MTLLARIGGLMRLRLMKSHFLKRCSLSERLKRTFYSLNFLIQLTVLRLQVLWLKKVLPMYHHESRYRVHVVIASSSF